MRRIKVGFFLLSMFLLVTAADAGTDEYNRTLSVIGQGKAAAPPDMATVWTGVITQKPSAADALSANNEAMGKVMGVLKAQKIAVKDIQTSSFNVTPEYRQDERGRQQPEIIGYRATNQVRVEVHSLENLGNVLDALVRSGSNQVSGIRFGIEDPADVLNRARKRAIADARSRAELYAQASGVRVGKVLTISEQPIESAQPKSFRRVFAAESLSSVPLETGEQEFQVQVHMVFAIEDDQ